MASAENIVLAHPTTAVVRTGSAGPELVGINDIDDAVVRTIVAAGPATTSIEIKLARELG